MAIYIDASTIEDIENIPSEVFRYLIKKHKERVKQLQKNYDYYVGKHAILSEKTDDEEKVKVFSNYAKYTVDISTGYYIGEPVKYNSDDKKKQTEKGLLNNGVQATIKNGSISQYDWKNASIADITRVIEAYDNQTMSDNDATLAKDIGIFGEAYELEYASDSENPEPRTAVFDPRNCIMVRDNTVEHHKLFFMTYEELEDLKEEKYYEVNVYTDHNSRKYRSKDLDNFEFHPVADSEQEHYFGEVPAVEYQNNNERQGDYEQIIPLIDGFNELLSDRITDKKKFVNSLLAMFGITMDSDSVDTLKKERFIDGIPLDARIEYIQKVFDEGAMSVLCNDIIREMHKMTLTVDMTDENFAGNSSGQALMLKLMTMNILVKNKMRSFEKGLKKRFELYNQWLTVKGDMNIIDKKDVDIIFTIALPIDKREVVDMVVSLQGIVDQKTLLQQLWFIKDVDEVVANLEIEKAQQQQEYLDSFAKQKAVEETFNDYDSGKAGETEKEGE